MAVRVDIIERLADCIRPLIAWRATPESSNPPEGAVDGNAFRVTVTMTSLLGCAGEDFASVLRALGYRMERRPAPAAAPAETGPVEAVAVETPDEAPAVTEDAAATAPRAEDAMETAAPLPVDEAVADVLDTVDAPDEDEAAEPAAPADEIARPEAEGVVAEAAGPGEVAVSAIEMSPDSGPEVEAAGDAGADAASTSEPAFIEVWRPHRFGRRPDQRRGRPKPSHEARPRDAVSGEASPADGERQRSSRRDRPRDALRADRQGGDHKGRPPRHGPRPDRGDRPPRPEREQRPERQKQADPLSPFAALAALKAQLEAQKRDG
jgi:ATP-dependent RNA helicase SUPV3L1/SUV3